MSHSVPASCDFHISLCGGGGGARGDCDSDFYTNANVKGISTVMLFLLYIDCVKQHTASSLQPTSYIFRYSVLIDIIYTQYKVAIVMSLCARFAKTLHI